MKCKYCGAEIPNGTNFCPNCGKDLSQLRKCVKCGEIIDDDVAFCPYCGAEQPVYLEDKPWRKWLWIVGFIVLVVMIVAGACFLYQRHNLPSSAAPPASEDDSLSVNTDSVAEDQTPKDDIELTGSDYQMTDNVWVDMGTTDANGNPVYWAPSDLVKYEDGNWGIAEPYYKGCHFHWTSENIDYASNLGDGVRMPTKDELNDLVENCEWSRASYKISIVGKNGLPSWVQGQWMVEISQGYSITVKIDGDMANVLRQEDGTFNTEFEGTYSYSNRKLVVGSYQFRLENNTLIDQGGNEWTKISDKTENGVVAGLLCTSPKTGNSLFFPTSSSRPVSISSNNGTNIEFRTESAPSYFLTKEYYKDEDHRISMICNYEDLGRGMQGITSDKLNQFIRPVSTKNISVRVGGGFR